MNLVPPPRFSTKHRLRLGPDGQLDERLKTPASRGAAAFTSTMSSAPNPGDGESRRIGLTRLSRSP